MGGVTVAEGPIVSLSHVDAGYPGATILADVSFDIAPGEIFILLGGSGCGKSTILKHMIGLNPVLAGTLTVAGLEWTAATREGLCRRIVMLPLEEFTRLSRAERRERAMGLLRDVELADAANLMPSEISGGMCKRVAIARAMALDPEVVFLDEPSAGLDPITSSSLDDLILRLREEKGMTFVVVSHELASIFKIADRAAMFDKSRRAMVALGVPAELRDSSDDPFVRRFFNRGESDGK